MEIEVEETDPVAHRCLGQPVRSRQVVELVMETSKGPAKVTNGPGALLHHCDHVRSLDALQNHVETIRAEFVNRGHGESLASDIVHDSSLLVHGAALS